MTDMKINGAGAGQALPALAKPGKEPGSGFNELMQEALDKISQVQTDADKSVNELASGGDATQAVVAMEKADMNFQLMVEVRNKLLSAYEEIMRMQV